MPRHRVERRRLGLLALTAVLALSAGAIAGSGSGGETGGDSGRAGGAVASRQARAQALPAPRTGGGRALSLRELVGQTIVLSFAGPRVPAYVTAIMRESRVAGAILFRDNVASLAGVRSLTRSLQRAAKGGALVMTDQEGGAVRTFTAFGPGRGQGSLSTPASAAAGARIAARGLLSAGVNVVLAPVLDVARGPASALAGRAYPGGAAAVAAAGRAAAGAYAAAGIAATVKHFPGLGAARVNTDSSGARIELSAATLAHVDMAPYVTAIAAGVPLVMIDHASYPALDPRHIASQSARVIGGQLRARLGFRGVVITDSLEARAVISRSSVAIAAERSLRAGADLLLLTGPGSYPLVYRHLLALAKRSPALRARMTQAVARTLALKRRLGLKPPP